MRSLRIVIKLVTVSFLFSPSRIHARDFALPCAGRPTCFYADDEVLGGGENTGLSVISDGMVELQVAKLCGESFRPQMDSRSAHQTERSSSDTDRRTSHSSMPAGFWSLTAVVSSLFHVGISFQDTSPQPNGLAPEGPSAIPSL